MSQDPPPPKHQNSRDVQDDLMEHLLRVPRDQLVSFVEQFFDAISALAGTGTTEQNRQASAPHVHTDAAAGMSADKPQP